jgi:Cytochrome P460
MSVCRLGLPAGLSAGITIPQGYRDWKLISVATLGPPDNDIRAVLGNDIAIGAYREGKLPFPNGAIIARLAWKQSKDPASDNALSHEPLNSGSIQKLLSGSFAAGSPTNVQFMVRDSTQYASTGGWGFAQFTGGKPDAIVQRSCWSCHALAPERGFVFTRYSP